MSPPPDIKPRTTSTAAPTIIGNTVTKPTNPPSTAPGPSGPGGGKPKMMFKPVVPVRRKVETAPVAEPTVSSDHGRGRGSRAGGERGRGGNSGRGRGSASRGAAAPMTASGVFSMGPSNIGARKSTIRTGPSGGMLDGAAPVYKLPEDRKPNLDGEEEYSDQENGVEVVDMSHLESLDVLAPKGLRRDPLKVKKVKKTKAEDGKGKDRAVDPMEVSDEENEAEEINLGQALDLSESEDEEEQSDVRGDFIGWDGELVPPNQLYFFQFPRTFPTFLPLPENSTATVPEGDSMDVDDSASETPSKRKAALVAPAEKPAGEAKGTEGVPQEKQQRMPEGQIGTLLITRKGKVKMRLGNGFLFDINSGSQLDFLQQFVNIDEATKKVTTLAETKRRFIATPDMDKLLQLLMEEGTGEKKVEASEVEEGLVPIGGDSSDSD